MDKVEEVSGHRAQGIRARSGFILLGMTGGHGVFHWFTQSLIALLPEVQEAFGLGGVGVGGISATREFVSGVVTLPGGVIADSLRKYWGLILAICMALYDWWSTATAAIRSEPRGLRTRLLSFRS